MKGYLCYKETGSKSTYSENSAFSEPHVELRSDAGHQPHWFSRQVVADETNMLHRFPGHLVLLAAPEVPANRASKNKTRQ